MKTQKKNGQRLYLQTKNKRWKWMAGATAASVAGVTSAQAGTITINLLNNYISATGGNHLNADLTGDGHPDLTIANAIYYQHYYRTSLYGRTIFRALAAVDLNAVHASAYGNEYPLLYVRLGSQVRGETNPEYFPVSLTGSIPISFNDLHINAGRLTSGSLEVTVSAGPDEKVQLDSFTYKTPDQGSSLALLAMGAGGILALRRLRAAQVRS